MSDYNEQLFDRLAELKDQVERVEQIARTVSQKSLDIHQNDLVAFRSFIEDATSKLYSAENLSEDVFEEMAAV